MKLRLLIILVVALFAAASSTLAGVDVQGVSTNGSSLQGVSTNGSSLQGVSTNGSSLQGVPVDGVRVQSATQRGAAGPRPVGPSTGLKLRAVHLVGGRLVAGHAPSRTPRQD